MLPQTEPRSNPTGECELTPPHSHAVAAYIGVLRGREELPRKANFGPRLPPGVNSTDPNFQCGYLEIYHDSSDGDARLAVAKYAATNPEMLGSIFFNPGTLIDPSLVVFLLISISTGGPGVSGIEAVVKLGPSFSLASHGHIDFISWDLRGVGYTMLVHIPISPK